MKKRIIALAVSAALAIAAFTGCGSPAASKSASEDDLMKNIEARPLAANVQPDENDDAAAADFALRLFRENAPGSGNMMISPISVLSAMAMTANGARGETLEQMEKAFGLSIDEVNRYLGGYIRSLPSDKDAKLSMANSIWLRDSEDFAAKEEFLQTNADYYGSGVFKAAFDSDTLRDINKWVEKNTDGMIKNILNDIPDSTMMYLINAIAFDAKWQEQYEKDKVDDSTFTTEDGREQTVKMMYSTEHTYLRDENAQGFVKYYKGENYAFAALLPNEGVSVADYAASLTGEKLMSILDNAVSGKVNAGLPEFESEYSVEMSEVLQSMGIVDAFDSGMADFSGISDSGLMISRVLHKSYISVDAQGTKAAAATVVDLREASDVPDDTYTVILDRPFVYMIIDCGSNMPLFIGTMMSA